jgi:hypothetical protein
MVQKLTSQLQDGRDVCTPEDLANLSWAMRRLLDGNLGFSALELNADADAWCVLTQSVRRVHDL